MKSLVLALILCLLPPVSRAASRTLEDGCVKYVASGRSYDVQVHLVDGSDLWPKYSWANTLSKYAIVFWDKEEATVIDLGVFGLLFDTGTDGKDLQGRQWKVGRRPWC